MTGTERIRKKILQDAAEAAETVMEAGRLEADGIRATAGEQRRAAEADTDRRIDAARIAHEQRNAATLQMEMRKQALSVRQRMVDEAFRQAAAGVADLPVETYRALIAAMIRSSAWQGDAELVVSGKDRDKLGSGFPKEIEAMLQQEGLSGTLRYAADALPVHGGFVLRRGEMEVNGTLEVVMAGIRPKLERQVAEILFGEFR